MEGGAREPQIDLGRGSKFAAPLQVTRCPGAKIPADDCECTDLAEDTSLRGGEREGDAGDLTRWSQADPAAHCRRARGRARGRNCVSTGPGTHPSWPESLV